VSRFPRHSKNNLFCKRQALFAGMNTLTLCTHNNCFTQFKDTYDYIHHYETTHLPDADNRRLHDIEELGRNIENAEEGNEKDQMRDHLNAIYNQSMRMSQFFKFVSRLLIESSHV
jgi:superfamily I DNA/RNA helicase